MPCELALGDLDHREHRIERDETAISLPAKENAACPTSTGTSLTTPDHGARTTPRSRSASAAASAASAAELCFEFDRSSRGSVPVRPAALGLELGALHQHRARLHDLRLARLVGQDGDDVALLHLLPRTLSSVTTPAARAVTITRLSASVRPDSTSLRLCGTTVARTTATRNGFFIASAAVRSAASVGAGWCGSNCPEAIHSPAAATMPSAVKCRAFIVS